MEVFFIIIVVAFIVMSSTAKANADKKRREQQAAEAARRANYEAQQAERTRQAAPRQAARPAVSPRVGGWHCACGADNAASAGFCTRCGRPRAEAATGSLAYASSEGTGTGGSLGGVSNEGRGGYEGEPAHAPKTTLRHAVKPVTESRHAHTEESITGGGEPCTESYEEDVHADAYSLETGVHTLPYGLTFTDKDEVIRGLLYSEIFGKPKALRGRG